MNRLFVLLVFLLVFSGCSRQVVNSDSRPVSHEIWDGLLKKHVSEEGKVNYKGFLEDRDELKRYLELLSANHPNEKNWSEKQRLAYWINVYNAFTVELVVRNYPVEGIRDIKNGIPFVNSVWDIKFFEIEGKKYDLNEVEHGILRKEFDEPRIHFAIVCASVSCPNLRNEAYTDDQLEAQLQEEATRFVNDGTKNQLAREAVKVSKIFSWFKKDFTKRGTLIDFLNKYANTKINPDATVGHLDYDWSLNE